VKGQDFYTNKQAIKIIKDAVPEIEIEKIFVPKVVKKIEEEI